MVWRKGESGNPGGRPKVDRTVQELAQAHGAEAIKTLGELMRKASDDRVRVQAATALLDRGYGKPHQTSSVDVTQTDVRRLGDAELDLAIAGALAREKGEKRRSGLTH